MNIKKLGRWIHIDKGDGFPIWVDTDGFMSLEDAKVLREDLSRAIRSEERARK